MGVLGAVGFTLIFTTVLWVGIYFLCYWLLIFKRNVFDQRIWETPPGFVEEYAITGLALMIIAWICDRFAPADRARDQRSKLELLFNIVMFLPRCTLSMLESFSAWVRLSRKDLTVASTLIAYLQRYRRVAIHELPLEIPDESTRKRVLFGLDIMQIVDVRRQDDVFWLTLSSLAPKPFQPQRTQSTRQASPREEKLVFERGEPDYPQLKLPEN